MIHRTLALVPALVGLCACHGPASGTFVGNPSMTARIADNDVQQARGGHLEVSDAALIDCEEGDDVSLGGWTFRFAGAGSADVVQLPDARRCGLSLHVDELQIRFDEGDAQTTTLIASEFELALPERFQTEPGGRYMLRLGDAAWLAGISALASPGEVHISEAAPELQAAFFDGLQQGSGVESGGAPESDPLPGRLNLDGYPESPLGTPSQFPGCGPGVAFHLAVPIPHAAMATLDLGDGEVGWCEGEVIFSDDLLPISAIQQDYSDLSTYTVEYNGWGQGCGSVHCNQVYSSTGIPQDRACTVLALCDDDDVATVVGFYW